jgi:hypothetical protein
MNHSLAAGAALILFLSRLSAYSEGINPIKCEVTEGGKRIRIIGSNPSNSVLMCSTAKCEAPAQNGTSRICDIKSRVPLQPGTTNVELANCYDENNAAHSPASESHTCF